MHEAAKSSLTIQVKSSRRKHVGKKIWKTNYTYNITNNSPSNILWKHSLVKSYCQKYHRLKRQYLKKRLTLMLLVAIITIQIDAKKAETLACGYSSERTQWELSNEYQHDRV